MQSWPQRLGHCNFPMTTIHLTSCPLSPSSDDSGCQGSSMSHNTPVLVRVGVGKDLCMVLFDRQLLIICSFYKLSFCVFVSFRKKLWSKSCLNIELNKEKSCLTIDNAIFTRPMVIFPFIVQWHVVIVSFSCLWIRCFWPLWLWLWNSSEWILI